MNFIPTEEQWHKMQKHIRSDAYKKEDFFVFETLAVGDRVVPNRYMKLMPDLLDTMKEDAIKGVSLMLNHNWSQIGVQSIPIGKVFDARIGAGTQEGETTALYTTQYILRDDSKLDGYSKNDIIKLIETGTLSDTSIGWGTERECYKCSICGNSIYDFGNCKHIPGRKYIVNEETDEVKECIVEVHSPAHKHAGNNVLMENSIVFDGAYPNAIIQSSIGNEIQTKNGVLKPLEDKQELSQNDIIIGYSTNGSYNLLYKKSIEKGGTEQMDEAEKQETEVVETETVETQAVNAEETPVVEETAETVETQANENVEETVETPAKEEEKMYSEKELLEKFSDVAPDLEALIVLAKEGLAHRNEVIEEALTKGVRSMGNAFNKEAFNKTFSNMTTKDIKDIGDVWEKQVNEKFSTELISDVSKTVKNTEKQIYANKVDLSNYKTLPY